MSESKAKSLNSPWEKMRQNKTDSKTDPSVKAFFSSGQRLGHRVTKTHVMSAAFHEL